MNQVLHNFKACFSQMFVTTLRNMTVGNVESSQLIRWCVNASIDALGHIYFVNDNDTVKFYYIQALKLNDSSILTSLKYVTGYLKEGECGYFEIIKDCADHECAAANLEMCIIYISKERHAEKDEIKAAE